MDAGTFRGQNRVSHLQKLVSQPIVSLSIWVLATKLRSPVRAVCSLNH